MNPKKPTSDDPAACRYLGYAMPRADHDREQRVIPCGDFTLHDVPLGSSVSFPDYDGVVVFGGSYERLGNRDYMGEPSVGCVSYPDLDLRERELFSALQHGKTVIFLLHLMPTIVGYHSVPARVDLFRRIADNLGVVWQCWEQPSPLVESLAPEFRDYVSRYGTGYIELSLDRKRDEDFYRPLCTNGDRMFGLVIAGKLFFLPTAIPQTTNAVQQIVTAAISAVRAYRKRMSSEMPAWIGEFAFSREMSLQQELEEVQKKAMELEGEIGAYRQWKAVLCFQSDPLVNVVTRMLEHFFGIIPTVDDKCIDDATLQDANGQTVAVFEIKGVKGNFTRNNVNQVDSHRERLNLPSSTPGVLIMNTMMGATSLAEKDERPHPDIIKKAEADRVLLVRTLDLLRYAEGVENGSLPKDSLLQAFFGEAGWLKVENGKAQVVKG